MNTLSAVSKSLLIFLILCVSMAYGADREWPVKGEISLSSTFCDFRPAHFHGGIDIRTGGVEGRKVYAPVDGYIWRIRYSYIGYGKGLYLKDSQGFIYVFGHLSQLSKKLEKIVENYQYKNKRYYCDLVFEPDSIPVTKGELIAYSGQTGYGAPHLHFEIRTPDNMPLNPLTNGFPLEDKIPPEFEAIGFVYQDSVSLFPDGSRRLSQKVDFNKKERKYVIESPVVLSGPFGIEIKASDRIRERTRKLNIYQAKLYIDNYLYYEITFEKYNYDQTQMVDLTYDYALTVDDNQYWHLLYKPTGDNFDGGLSSYQEGGIYKARTGFGLGDHEGRVEIYDAAGNMSQLVFHFVMLPTGDLFRAEWMNDSTLYFIGRLDNKYLKIENIEIFGTTGAKGWQLYDPERVKMGGSSDYYITLPQDMYRPKGLRVEVAGTTGWEYYLYYGLVESDKQKYLLDYKLLPDGISFDIFSQIRYGPPPHIRIVYEDGYIDTIPSTIIKPDKYAAFYRNDRIKSKIIRFETLDPATGFISDKQDVEMFLAGVGPDAVIYSNSGGFNLKMQPGDFYIPTMIEPYKMKTPPRKSGEIVGYAYTIRPITTPLKNSIDVAFNIGSKTDNSHAGLYRLNNKNIWKWVDSKKRGGTISAAAGLTGSYAILNDTRSPRVKNIHPRKGRKVHTARPTISCTINEDLSGIADDKDISVTLDGHWLIPEYDPETEQLRTHPDRALADGKHELVITVTDRAGNSRQVFSYFYVEKK